MFGLAFMLVGKMIKETFALPTFNHAFSASDFRLNSYKNAKILTINVSIKSVHYNEQFCSNRCKIPNGTFNKR